MGLCVCMSQQTRCFTRAFLMEEVGRAKHSSVTSLCPHLSHTLASHVSLLGAGQTRRSLGVEEVERAKRAAVSIIYNALESKATSAEDIGRQFLTYGHRWVRRQQ